MTVGQEPIKKGRPVKDKSKNGQVIVRMNQDILNRLDDIVQAETEKTGYNITRSDFIRKAIDKAIKDYSI